MESPHMEQFLFTVRWQSSSTTPCRTYGMEINASGEQVRVCNAWTESRGGVKLLCSLWFECASWDTQCASVRVSSSLPWFREEGSRWSFQHWAFLGCDDTALLSLPVQKTFLSREEEKRTCLHRSNNNNRRGKKKKQYQQGQKKSVKPKASWIYGSGYFWIFDFPFLQILQCLQNVSYPQGWRMWCAHLQSECNKHMWHKVEISFHEGRSTNAENSELQAHRKICLVKQQTLNNHAPLCILIKNYLYGTMKNSIVESIITATVRSLC